MEGIYALLHRHLLKILSYSNDDGDDFDDGDGFGVDLDDDYALNHRHLVANRRLNFNELKETFHLKKS